MTGHSNQSTKKRRKFAIERNAIVQEEVDKLLKDKFEWTDRHEAALNVLKDHLSSAPALMKPENGESLSLYLAISAKVVSVILVKDHEGSQHPVYYVSKILLDAEARYVLRKTEIAGRMAKWIVKLNAYDIKYEPRTVIKSEALADFVADFSSDLQREAELEVQQLEKTKDPWTLFTDGASNVKGT